MLYYNKGNIKGSVLYILYDNKYNICEYVCILRYTLL